MARPPISLEALTRVLRTADLVEEVHGPEDVAVHGVTQDSRSVHDGDLFLAWRGAAFDAHDFVADAARSGAAAAVVERHVPEAPIPQVRVTDGRHAAALAADTVFGSPWTSLFTAAVTGTNGKTTTAFLARWVLGGRGPAASIGTRGVTGPDGRTRPGTEGLTTPGPVDTARGLRELADEGVESVVFEASSHALDQRRLDGVRFDAVAFTNLSQDHLDYHVDYDAYRAAKVRLVELKKPAGTALVNADEPAWVGSVDDEAMRFGTGPDTDLRSENVDPHTDGTRFTLVRDSERADVDLPLLGDFNVENALAAAGIGTAAGLDLADIAARLNDAPQVPGRLEVVSTTPVRVLIDFAHTPDALERVLRTLRPRVTGRLIVVFGAGGDRDAGKRPLMGAAVARGADRAIVTSDNPRTEDPETIIDDVVAGMAGMDFERIADRCAAIHRAIEVAGTEDCVLLAGKGHEAYQVLGTEKKPFDEAAIAREALAPKRGIV